MLWQEAEQQALSSLQPCRSQSAGVVAVMVGHLPGATGAEQHSVTPLLAALGCLVASDSSNSLKVSFREVVPMGGLVNTTSRAGHANLSCGRHQAVCSGIAAIGAPP